MILFLEHYNDDIEKSYNKLNKEWNEIKTKISFIEVSESQLVSQSIKLYFEIKQYNIKKYRYK